LPLTVRKLLLIVGQSVVPPFPLLMDLLSTPLRTDCTRTCERETLIRPLTQPFRLLRGKSIGAAQFCTESGFQGLEATKF
jgi:hypothetical protein